MVEKETGLRAEASLKCPYGVLLKVLGRPHTLAILYSFTAAESDIFCYSSKWILVAPRSLRQSAPDLVRAGEILAPSQNFRMWTDDFSNMWSILR